MCFSCRPVFSGAWGPSVRLNRGRSVAPQLQVQGVAAQAWAAWAYSAPIDTDAILRTGHPVIIQQMHADQQVPHAVEIFQVKKCWERVDFWNSNCEPVFVTTPQLASPFNAVAKYEINIIYERHNGECIVYGPTPLVNFFQLPTKDEELFTIFIGINDVLKLR